MCSVLIPTWCTLCHWHTHGTWAVLTWYATWPHHFGGKIPYYASIMLLIMFKIMLAKYSQAIPLLLTPGEKRHRYEATFGIDMKLHLVLLLWLSAVTNLQVIKIIWVMWCMGGQGEAWSWERTALTRHQVMWEGEWRDVYAKKTTAAFTRSFIHFSLSLIVSTWVQAPMQLISHTPGPSYHTPHVIHMAHKLPLQKSH